MRWLRIAGVLAVVAPALAAQTAGQSNAPRAVALTAEVDYGTAGDAWITTNKPAYVALFDVSRGGVTQLYPMFTQEAEQLSGTSLRVDLHSQRASQGRSALVSLNTPQASTSAQGWPHTLLLVASTMPLRVGSMWDSNITLNNDLVRDHDWNTLNTDEGVAAVIGLVRPVDWGAEVVTSELQTATPAVYASSLAHDPNQTALGYSCWDANHTFTSITPVAGASCFAVREFPASTVAARVVPPRGPVGTVDTARVLSTSRHPAASATSGSPRVSTNRQSDVQSISDPAAIRKFMEAYRSGNAANADGGPGAAGHPSDASGARAGSHDSQWRDQRRSQSPNDANPDANHGSHRNIDRAESHSPSSPPPSHAPDSKPSNPNKPAPAHE